MQYVVKQNAFFHHFLVSVCGYANILCVCLGSQPVSDCMVVMRIYLIHNASRLLCIRNAFKIFFLCPTSLGAILNH